MMLGSGRRILASVASSATTSSLSPLCSLPLGMSVAHPRRVRFGVPALALVMLNERSATSVLGGVRTMAEDKKASKKPGVGEEEEEEEPEGPPLGADGLPIEAEEEGNSTVRWPRQLKFPKMQRGDFPPVSWRETANELEFGSFGLRVLEPCFLTPKQIEAARRVIKRTTDRKGSLKTRVLPDHSYTRKGLGVRMGKGKGSHYAWVAKVSAGKMLFELSHLTKRRSRYALEKAAKKLPCKTAIVMRKGWHKTWAPAPVYLTPAEMETKAAQQIEEKKRLSAEWLVRRARLESQWRMMGLPQSPDHSDSFRGVRRVPWTTSMHRMPDLTQPAPKVTYPGGFPKPSDIQPPYTHDPDADDAAPYTHQ